MSGARTSGEIGTGSCFGDLVSHETSSASLVSKSGLSDFGTGLRVAKDASANADANSVAPTVVAIPLMEISDSS